MRDMVFDVESVGLHGGGFAVAWVVLVDGKRVSECWVWCDPSKVRGIHNGLEWVKENVLLEDSSIEGPPGVKVDHPRQVRQRFWDAWQIEKAQGAQLWADVPWPVEARFLTSCVEDVRRTNRGRTQPEGERDWAGPYPLLDIATFRLAAGFDPMETCERQADEKPAHHPLADARQSARLLVEARYKLDEQ